MGPRERDRLWTVTLHYHAWAWKLARMVRHDGARGERASILLRHYLADWIDRCGPEAEGSRHLAWNAYAVATRIGWWTRLYHLLGARGRRDWGPLGPVFLAGLWRQAAYLHERLEWDLRGNHLMRDAVGLAWAGRFFQGPEAKRWLRTAEKLAAEQAEEQVLPDGGHFERSPMYHVQVMEDLLTLALLVEDPATAARLRETWTRMAEFLRWTRHPDGRVPLFNDAALNGACEPERMLEVGGRAMRVPVDRALPSGGRHFPAFGLAVWHDPTWSVFFDVGPVGADYQPGHAHADTLNFECSCRGRRLIVDPGTYAYDLDDRRAYDRSTAAHNTVCIDDEDSSEVWHIFRVGRRARPGNLAFAADAAGFKASAAHDGYRFLPGRPRHHRELTLTPQGPLRIVDRIIGRGRHTVTGGLLIHPGWRVHRTDAHSWRLQAADQCVTLRFTADQPIECTDAPAPYHPEFGVEQTTRRLTWRYHGSPPLRVETHITASPPLTTDRSSHRPAAAPGATPA